MELGHRIKQARLDAGLSQRQLCGDTITRNMLSLIENGSAKPSMDTLRILAARLEKPMAYFLEEQAALSPNAAVMAQVRDADPAQVLEILKGYKGPDKDFDRERYLLEVLACFALAERAIREKRAGLAAHYLTRAAAAGAQTPYYTQDLERRRVLLLADACAEDAAVLASLLPDSDDEFLLRAQAALAEENFSAAQAFLDCVTSGSNRWQALQGQVFFAQGQWEQAAAHFAACRPDKQICEKLELCYKQLQNFEKAYYYACKQREY